MTAALISSYVAPPGLLDIRDFGGVGDGVTNNDAAIAAALAKVYANLAYHGAGAKSQSGLWFPPGQWLFHTSINCTTINGAQLGVTIAGAGKLQTVLMGELTDGPYPALDVTGMYNVRLRDFQLACSSTSLASIGILIAQATGDTFVTYYPLVDNVLVEMNVTSPNYVGGLVVQNGDLAVIRESYINGHTFMGQYLPISHAGTAQAGSSGTITLDSGASATNSAYDGLSVTLIHGTGVGQTTRITAYVGSTKVATVSPHWTTAPDSTSVFRVWQVASKYQVIPGTPDQTIYNLNNSSFVGPCGLVLCQAFGISMTGAVYVAANPALDSRISAIYAEVSNPYTTNPLKIFGHELFTENQTTGSNAYAISTENSSTHIDIHGYLNWQNQGATATGASLRDVGTGAYSSIALWGEDNSGVLFHLTNSCPGTLMGQYRTNAPGTVNHFAAIYFDWVNSGEDAAWIAALSSVAPFGMLRGYQLVNYTSQSVILNDIAPTTVLNAGFGGKTFLTTTAYTGGSGAAGVASVSIEANAMVTGTNVQLRTLNVRMGGAMAAASTVELLVKQASSGMSQALFTASFASGEVWHLDFDLQSGAAAGTSLSASGVYHHGASSGVIGQDSGGFTGFNPAALFTVEIWVNSGSNNPISEYLEVYRGFS